MNIRYIEQQIVLSEPLKEIIVPNTTTTSTVPLVTTTTKKVDAKDAYIGYLNVLNGVITLQLYCFLTSTFNNDL